MNILAVRIWSCLVFVSFAVQYPSIAKAQREIAIRCDVPESWELPAGVCDRPVAPSHAYRPGQRPNFIAMKDSAKIGVLFKSLEHDVKGCFYTSESDEPVSVIISTGTPPGKPCDLTAAFDGLECAADSDEEAKLRVRLVHIDLEKTKNLRAYKVGGEDAVNPTYIIGGDIGESFVGIKAKATET